MTKITEETRDELNARLGDIIKHLEMVTRETINLSAKVAESGFKIAKGAHESLSAATKQNSN